MHPIHSIMGNVLGMSVSTAVVICHTSVTVSVTGSNLVSHNVCSKTACYVTVNMSNVSFETVVRQRVMGCARSSDNDEGQEDTIVRPQPKQEVADQQDSSRTTSAA